MRTRPPGTATPSVPEAAAPVAEPHLWAQSAEKRPGARSTAAPRHGPALPPAPLSNRRRTRPAYPARTGPPPAALYFRGGALATGDAALPAPRLLPGLDCPLFCSCASNLYSLLRMGVDVKLNIQKTQIVASDNTPRGWSAVDAAAVTTRRHCHRRTRGEPSRPCCDPRSAAGRPSAQSEPGREEMYQARPLSRNLFLYTFLQNHGPGFLDDQDSGLPGVTSILEFHSISPYSDSPHYLAMQLASIADEMELRLLLPQFVEPFWMPVYSLFFPYSHVGLRDVLRSFMVAFTNLRENRRLWSFLTLRDRVSPSLWPELALSLLVVAMLSWGCRFH
ncbi:hypothetical protein AB1E19_004565 [Capra hircus]